MFKNATLYRLVKLPDDMADNMDASRFTSCGATQDKSIGWIPPRDEHGALIEPVHSRWFVKVAIETKSVPSSEINKTVDAACVQIEQMTGRKPGKKEKRELKENALLELLPQAFPKRKDVMVMIDREHELVFIDTASTGVADDVVTLLVRAGLELALVQTSREPFSFMTNCLLDENDDVSDFILGRECVLEAQDESKAKVTFKNHSLQSDEVRKHITEGKLPAKLALSDKDGTEFVLTGGLKLTKIKYGVPDAGEAPESDKFDADCVLIGSALSSLATTLISSLGGIMTFDLAAEAPGEPSPYSGDGPDPLYDAAQELVMEEQRASISLIQRHLKIGYNRAARLLEQMEVHGLVSPMQANGERKILESA